MALTGSISEHFSWEELRDKEDHDFASGMDDNVRWLVNEKLEPLRAAVGHPLTITSGYRHPDHKEERGKAFGPGAHSHGLAVDIQIHGADVLPLVCAARELEVMGVGVAQRAACRAERFVHLDWWDGDAQRPRPWVWSY